MADALSGQFYRNTIRDRRGNALEDITVEVLDAGTQELLYTATTDANGEYAIPLVDELEDRRLVNLRVSGSGIDTRTIEAITLI